MRIELLRFRIGGVLISLLLPACALIADDDAYPYSSGWRRVPFAGVRTEYSGLPFRDCRIFKSGESFLLFQEREKKSRFTTVVRDWLMPLGREVPRPDTVAMLNIDCSHSYKVAEPLNR